MSIRWPRLQVVIPGEECLFFAAVICMDVLALVITSFGVGECMVRIDCESLTAHYQVIKIIRIWAYPIACLEHQYPTSTVISLRIETASSAIVGNTWDNNGLASHMKKSPLLATTTEQQLMMIFVSWPQKTTAPRSMATTASRPHVTKPPQWMTSMLLAISYHQSSFPNCWSLRFNWFSVPILSDFFAEHQHHLKATLFIEDAGPPEKFMWNIHRNIRSIPFHCLNAHRPLFCYCIPS